MEVKTYYIKQDEMYKWSGEDGGCQRTSEKLQWYVLLAWQDVLVWILRPRHCGLMPHRLHLETYIVHDTPILLGHLIKKTWLRPQTAKINAGGRAFCIFDDCRRHICGSTLLTFSECCWCTSRRWFCRLEFWRQCAATAKAQRIEFADERCKSTTFLLKLYP